MIDFKPLKLSDKKLYQDYLFNGEARGCEFSFANLYLWGSASVSLLNDHMVFFAQYSGPRIYPYPLGNGDKKPIIDAILQDANKRGIECKISGIPKSEQPLLEALYPGKFHFHFNRDSYDYIYDINDLADLKGRKYHRKRNHLHRFYEAVPNYHIEPLNENNLPLVKQMLKQWYAEKMEENPENDFRLEEQALEKAFLQYQEIGLECLVLLDGDCVLAFTMGSRLSNDTFDVHFEKARTHVDGTYTAINNEFAKYIRAKYPDILFLDREEDMGIEGLRKAKESYLPHHLFEKCYATLVEEENDNK